MTAPRLVVALAIAAGLSACTRDITATARPTRAVQPRLDGGMGYGSGNRTGGASGPGVSPTDTTTATVTSVTAARGMGFGSGN